MAFTRLPLICLSLAALLPAGALAAGDPCAAHGPGFAPIAGTDTCVKIGGRVRVEYGFSSGGSGYNWRVGPEFNGPAAPDPSLSAPPAPVRVGPPHEKSHLRVRNF